MTDPLLTLVARAIYGSQGYPSWTALSTEHQEPFREMAQAALSVIREQEGWRPINAFSEPTAPSSGNGVLVADTDGTVGEAYFRNYGDSDDGWWWVNTGWGDYPEPERPRSPTHFRPLPTPPLEKM